jgi:hypothetical protein
MRKIFPLWTFTMLALALAAPAPHPANAQQADPSQGMRNLPLQHLAPDAMSVADRATLQARRADIAGAARIYGYNLEAGNWASEQTLCPPMPQTILLHYLQQFPDGTASLFTALVPRGAGRTRIVPVLYHNGTPFLPAPKNPRNYALFNELVPQAIASRDVKSSNDWLELSACYAEMTGSRTNIPPGSGIKVAIAGAPSATIHIDPQDNTARVTFASREGTYRYRVWSVSFNKNGRVIAAGAEDNTVYAAKAPAPQVQSAATAATPEASRPVQNNRQTAQAQGGAPKQPATETAVQPAQSPAQRNEPAIASVPPNMPSAMASANAGEQQSEPGWKFVLHPAEPASKVIPPAPPPPEKIVPPPPDPWNESAPTNQSPQ